MTLLRRLLSGRPAPGGGSAPPAMPTKSRTSTPKGTLIRRHSQRLHEERGWRIEGNTARGYYRTARGSFGGRIEGVGSAKPRYFISDPPRELLKGPHGACFAQRSKHEFSIHWNRQPRTIDEGILRVEHTILESWS